MKRVSIKYNPYKLETEITVDGKNLAQNSKLGERSADGSRLQEWVEELPKFLVEEFNDKEFDIKFHGTLLDWEDLSSVLNEAIERNELKAALSHEHAKETKDKEVLIDEVFNEIQDGPFDELRDPQIINAFKNAKSSDFEVCVVATMSAGKSTLINSMIRTKLMPSKQEACTAIITRIKDISSENIPFKAVVFDKEGNRVESYEKLTYPIMERLNSDDDASDIYVSGNIPFVKSDDVSLVLIDTPGPNNARDLSHRLELQKHLDTSSKNLILYIMTGEFGTDDDNTTLKRVAESMKVGGKQSKDRFIFVVNKLDDRKKEDGDINQTLGRVRSYLESHGISNPHLFPAAALPALNIQLMMMNNADIDDDTIDETEVKVKKLNRNSELHFETYAPLPASIRGEINGKLELARAEYVGPENENKVEALIHTGVVSIEAAIRQYVQKYAKTAIVKNIVDTFMKILEDQASFEKILKEIAENEGEKARIVKQIASINEKIDSAQDAMKFKNAVDDAVVKINDDSRDVIEKIIGKFQSRITKRIDELRGDEMELSEADDEVEELTEFAKELELEFFVDLEELIEKNLIETSKALLEGYRNKLSTLAEEIDVKDLTGVNIDPLKLMDGSIPYDDFTVEALAHDETVVVGSEWVKNTDKKWFKPWTWFQEDGYTRKITENRKFVSGDKLAQEFFKPVQDVLYENGDSAKKYALQQSKRIAERFNLEFKRLDDVLKGKLTKLESYATDREKAEERIKETKKRLQKLKDIRAKVESILEI